MVQRQGAGAQQGLAAAGLLLAAAGCTAGDLLCGSRVILEAGGFVALRPLHLA